MSSLAIYLDGLSELLAFRNSYVDYSANGDPQLLLDVQQNLTLSLRSDENCLQCLCLICKKQYPHDLECAIGDCLARLGGVNALLAQVLTTGVMLATDQEQRDFILNQYRGLICEEIKILSCLHCADTIDQCLALTAITQAQHLIEAIGLEIEEQLPNLNTYQEVVDLLETLFPLLGEVILVLRRSGMCH